MNIILATDHAGFELKERIKEYLLERGITVTDCGALMYDETDNYPDIIHPAIAKLPKLGATEMVTDMAIILGGSGQGESIVANRYPLVRSVVYYGGPLDIVRLGREHNNANVLSIGARFVDTETALQAVDLFINTEFEQGRHVGRVQSIESITSYE
jgi:ribose 5-phosphate isomerase B